jgi:molybdopterin synthase sulfur carrier subunit
MTITIKYFGHVADITQRTEEVLFFEEATQSLQFIQSKIEEKYPEIKNTSYSFAVNQTLVKEDFELSDNDEMALLPPFAGG